MSYKKLIPCIFIDEGKAVKWFDNREVLSENVVSLARYYSDHGADELFVFDLSSSDEEHEEAIAIMKKISRAIRIPMVAGGNIKRQEDIKKILYAGAKRAVLNFSKAISFELIEEAAKRFGKEKISVSLNDFDALFKQQHLIEECSSEILFMHRLDLDSVMNVTDIPCVVLTDTNEKSELFKILKCPGVKGLSGAYVSRTTMDLSLIHILRKLRELPNVKKVFIRSGIRFDYLMADKDDTFFRELCEHHVSGQLKVAPEHISDAVLQKMGKPENRVYEAFTEKYKKINQKLGKNQFLVPYLMSSHPGSTMKEAVELAEYLRDLGYMPEQVQDFYPTPSTISTCMYYTGVDPRTMEKVYVPVNPHEKAMQRALIQYCLLYTSFCANHSRSRRSHHLCDQCRGVP